MLLFSPLPLAAVPGRYFAGVHYRRKRKPALLAGVGEDAAIVAGRIVEQLRPRES